MKQQRVLFLGTPSFSIPFLETLLKDEFFEVVGVVTQPSVKFDASKKRSKPRLNSIEQWIQKKEWGKKISILKPHSLSDSLVKSQIIGLKLDLILIVAFGQILKSDFLSLFPNRIFNIHASLLPRWRGAAPIQRSLLAGDLDTGICLQIVSVHLDQGPILGERKVSISEDMDSKDLHDQLSRIGPSLIESELKKYLRGEIEPIKQEELIRKGRKKSYARKLRKEEFYIQWEKSSLWIAAQIRALALNSGPFCLRDKKILKIHKAKGFVLEKDAVNKNQNLLDGNQDFDFFKRFNSAIPGEILKIKKDSFYVACGEGYLQVFEVQPESKMKMKAKEYLKGYPLKLGDYLESKK